MAHKLKIDRKYYLMESELKNEENPNDPNLVTKIKFFFGKTG